MFCLTFLTINPSYIIFEHDLTSTVEDKATINHHLVIAEVEPDRSEGPLPAGLP